MSSALAAASLILKPEGYSEGRLQTLKPIEKLGSELVTNGGFDTDSDWTKDSGWSIENGQAVCNGAGINSLQQTSITTTGKIYKLSFDVLDSNNFNFLVISTNFGDTYIDADSNNSVVIGTNTFYIEPTNGTGIRFRVSDGTTLKIDNVSLKEVLVDGGDFTFTRGSNLSATRVNSAGLIEKGRENLLLQSNQFDTTWGGNVSNRSITGGFSGHDGTNNAWKLEALSNNNYSVVNQVVSSTGVQTFSIYAKAGTSNFFRIQITGGTNTSASYFDLSGSGSVGNDFNNIDAKIEPVGNGWFRCSVMGNKTTSTTCVVFVVDANNSSDVTTGANVYIQDAQLEAGMAATDYIETGASTVKAGILENTPRLDYSGGATEPSLLLEPQRTNLFNSSEYFDNWILQTNVNLTHNAINSPEGLINGVKYNISSNVQRAIDQNVTLSNGNTYTFSLYVKAIVDTTIRVRDDFGGWVEDINVLASDGWQRITSTKTITISSTQLGFFDNSGGDGDRFYFYGAQVEQGSYPTSYIPTYGTSVTRNAENKYLQNSSILSSGDGTIFWELDEFDTNTSADGFNQIIYVSKNSDSSLNDTIYLDEYIGTFRLYIRKNNILILRSETGYADLRGSKIAISWNSSGAKIFIDGVENASYVGDASNTFEFFGHDRPYNDAIKSSLKLKQEMYFPTALSDDECIALTTL